MKKKARVLLVSSYQHTLVKSDEDILRNHYTITAMNGNNRKLKIWDVPVFLFSLIYRIVSVQIVYAVFADFRTFCAALIGRILKKKLVVVIGGYEVATVPEFNYGELLTAWGRFKVGYILKSASVIIAPSCFSAKEVGDFSGRQDIQVIHPALKVEIPLQSKPRDTQVVMIASAIARYYPVYRMKGIETFVEASRYLPEYKFKLIGDYETAIKEKLLQINPAMSFLGMLSHEKVLEILRTSKVYCQLSYRESFGMAVVEAIAAGCIPVLCSGGALEEITRDYGIYVPFGDPEATVSAIRIAASRTHDEELIGRITAACSVAARESRLCMAMTGIDG